MNYLIHKLPISSLPKMYGTIYWALRETTFSPTVLIIYFKAYIILGLKFLYQLDFVNYNSYVRISSCKILIPSQQIKSQQLKIHEFRSMVLPILFET